MLHMILYGISTNISYIASHPSHYTPFSLGRQRNVWDFFVCLIFSCHNLKPWSLKLGSDFSADLVPELSGVSGRDSEPRWTLALCTRHLPSPLKPVTASFCSFKMLTQSRYFHRNVREWLESPDPTVCTCNLLDHVCCFPGWFSLIFTKYRQSLYCILLLFSCRVFLCYFSLLS